MRYAFAIAGLAVAASAGNTQTVTNWDEVTVTSCGPEKTKCPEEPYGWAGWQDKDNSKKTKTIWVDKDDVYSTWKNVEDEGYAKTIWLDKGDKQTLTWDMWTAKETKKADPTTWTAWEDDDKSKKTKTIWVDKDDKYSTWKNVEDEGYAKTIWLDKGDKQTLTWDMWTAKESKKADPTTWTAWEDKPKGPKTVTVVYTEWVDQPDKPKEAKTITKTITTEWEDQPAKPTQTGTWSEWQEAKPTNKYECPTYTDKAPPAWYAQLPTEVMSAMAAQWTDAPPKDWCYYSYSAAETKTAWSTWSNANAASTWSGVNAASASSWSNVNAASASEWAPVAQYTGGADAKAASFAFGGAAAIAALILV